MGVILLTVITCKKMVQDVVRFTIFTFNLELLYLYFPVSALTITIHVVYQNTNKQLSLWSSQNFGTTCLKKVFMMFNVQLISISSEGFKNFVIDPT